MSETTQTPRTDALFDRFGPVFRPEAVAYFSLCRELERELATATAQLQMFSDFAGGEIYMSDFQTATQMRERVNELQAQLAETKRELASRLAAPPAIPGLDANFYPKP